MPETCTGSRLSKAKQGAQREFHCTLRGTGLQGTQEIQEILLLFLRQLVEEAHYGIRFGAVSGMLLNGVDESTISGVRPAIVKKEDPLA